MNILVTGASSQIGQFLLPQLLKSGAIVVCVSRHKQAPDRPGLTWLKGDLTKTMAGVWQDNKASVWINLAALPLAIKHLDAATKAGIKRFIGFSSTSIFTKKASESEQEQATIQQLMAAERKLSIDAQKYAIAWTLFRPTMIYGCGKDQNIAFIQSIIRKFGVFPVAGRAQGLRQPVHAKDLAHACIQVLSLEVTYNKAYNLSGGEVLTYKEMVRRIFAVENRTTRIISIHPWIYKWAILIIKQLIPRYAFVETAMVDRMNMDMMFDHADASADFNFTPGPFQV